MPKKKDPIEEDKEEMAIHLMPGDGKVHEKSPRCWCRPRFEIVPWGDDPIWVHNDIYGDEG